MIRVTKIDDDHFLVEPFEADARLGDRVLHKDELPKAITIAIAKLQVMEVGSWCPEVGIKRDDRTWEIACSALACNGENP